MTFVQQQLLIAGLGILVCLLSTFGPVDQVAQNRSEYNPTFGNFIGMGMLVVFFPFARWLSRLVVLGGLQTTVAQKRGQTPQSFFVRSDFSKLNRWFLHVDEFGCDLDLKKKLQSKVER